MPCMMPPSSACGSFASSPSATSLFSKASYATDSTSLGLESHNFQPTPSTSGPNPAAKAASIHLPLHLPAPPCPLEEVDIASLIVDHELEGAPVGFAVGKLPVVELSLPSSSAFTILQGWIYLRAPLLLLSSLLPCPPPSASPSSAKPSSLSHLLNPSTPTSSTFSQSTPESLTQSLAAFPCSLLLKHVHIVHGVWSAAVALQVGDEDLWRVMGVAWQILVAALALRERERRLRASTPATWDEE